MTAGAMEQNGKPPLRPQADFSICSQLFWKENPETGLTDGNRHCRVLGSFLDSRIPKAGQTLLDETRKSWRVFEFVAVQPVHVRSSAYFQFEAVVALRQTVTRPKRHEKAPKGEAPAGDITPFIKPAALP